MVIGASALLLLPLLISGYLFNLIFYPLRYFSGRAEGQKLFFMAAGSGLTLTFFVFGITYLPTESDGLFARISAGVDRSIPIPHAFRAALTLAASIAIAACFNGILWLIHRKKSQSTAKCVYSWLTERFGSGLAQLLRRAAEEQRFVMLTLKSRKIYCGRVREAPTDTERDDVCVELVPLFSSYREQDTLRMGDRTEYPLIDLWAARRNVDSRIAERDLFKKKVDELGFEASHTLIRQELRTLDGKIEAAKTALEKFGNLGDVRAEDWIKVIPLKELESASFYDADAYQEWFSARSSTPVLDTTPDS